MPTSPLYLSAPEAAAELGVSRATLYAYVSRGLIASETVAGRRTRRYRADDIRTMLGRRDKGRSADEAAEGALHLGLPVLESSITQIADGKLFYRGRDAIALAREASLETIAAFLWNCRTDPFAAPLPGLPKLSGPSPVARAMQGLIHGSVSDDRAFNTSGQGIAETGARILRLLAAAYCDSQSSRKPIHEQFADAVPRPRRELADFLRRVLVLLADHELNASTFAARVVTSTGANPYLAVLGGLAALQGPRHGGNTLRVLALLDEATATGSPADTVGRRLRMGERLPGFGHPLYPAGDPRAQALMARLGEIGGTHSLFAVATATAKAGADFAGLHPNVDFALGAAIRFFGLADDMALGLFAVARVAGWIAHIGEQARDGRIIRPRARYVGIRPQINSGN